MVRPFVYSFALVLLSAPAFAQPVKSISLEGGFTVNGAPAQRTGLGTYKDVLVHPQDPDLVVKVFGHNWAESIPEKRLEVANIRAVEAVGAAPRLVEQGALMVDGKPTGFLVQERVHGLTMERPTPTKLAETAKLFEKLKKAKVELVDVTSLRKLQANIMVGETRSGGFGAYLVDADLKTTEKSARELSAFYDGLQSRLARGSN